MTPFVPLSNLTHTSKGAVSIGHKQNDSSITLFVVKPSQPTAETVDLWGEGVKMNPFLLF